MKKKYTTIVADEFMRVPEGLSPAAAQKLFEYPVPQLSADGSCAVSQEPASEPYNLRRIFPENSESLAYLWRLNNVVQRLQELVVADWIGIYQRVKKTSGEEMLVKVAYVGAFSRAEFPLTKEFAAHSNNSTVGLTGKPVFVQDVGAYQGPYYECDGRVRSELCCPILNKNGVVVGIIDAESFTANFFDEQKVLLVTQVCRQLSDKLSVTQQEHNVA